MEPALAEVRDQGIDWITCTAPPDGRDMALLVKADELLAYEEANGNELKRIKWQGYDLKKCGQAAAGLRDDGALVRLSGGLAKDHWRGLVPFARNITRLDLQVSVAPGESDRNLGARHLRELIAWRRQHDPEYKVSYTGSPEGIQTVNLGSRSSARYCRVYDKYAESQDDQYRDTWRYELEVKGDLASGLSRRLYHSAAPDLACGVYLFDYLAAHGIRPAYRRGEGIVRDVPYGRKSDLDRRLAWLAEQVAPALIQLEQRGRVDEALDALGVRQLIQRSTQATDPAEKGAA